MGNSQDKPPLRKALSVPDTHSLPPDAPVLYKEKSRSSQRLYQPNKGGNGKQSKSKIKKSKQQKEPQQEFQLPPSEAAFLPAFPLRGDLEDLDFEVIEVIAKGAYGNVIKVQREDDKRFYATKILDKAQILQEGAVRQCKDEASIQSMVGQHPFVVKAYEYWQSRTNLYLVLEYVPHGDMFTLWTFHGAFPEDLVRLYIAEMSLVLDYLHCECVIYRDIKMENILFDAMGHIQLTDFGLAKWLQSGDNTRTVCGTLQYMAPEVLSVYPYGHPADWWSVGILMYTMLAGRYPVDGMDTHTRMAQKVFECDYLLPSNISDSAQDVINRVLTKSPHKRLCNLYHLQDLHFFQDLIFSDLTDGKINPLDVVPADFFPMTGASWAPYVFSEEDNKQFDEFDDANAGYYDDYPPDGYNQHDQQPPQHDASSGYNSLSQTQSERPLNGYNQSHPQEETVAAAAAGAMAYPDQKFSNYDRSSQPSSAYPKPQTNSYDVSSHTSDPRTSAYPISQTKSYDLSSQPQDPRSSAYPNPQTNSYDRSSQPSDPRSSAYDGDSRSSAYDGDPRSGAYGGDPRSSAYDGDSRSGAYDNRSSQPQPSDPKSRAYPSSQTNSYDRSSQPFDVRPSDYSNPQTSSYERPAESSTMAYPQPAKRPSTATYNSKEQPPVNSSSRDITETDFNNDSSYPVENFNSDPMRRDRFDSSSSHSDTRRPGQMLSSSSSSLQTGQNPTPSNSEPYQTQSPTTYPYLSSHQDRDYKDGNKLQIGQRRVTRESYRAATSNEQNLHSLPSVHVSHQPPSLPQNPPPLTLTSQQPFQSPIHSSTNRDSNAFKSMEPAPTITLTPKTVSTNKNTPRNFIQNAYNPQVNHRVSPPSSSSATVVTSPSAKLPPSNRQSGYGQLEEAKIELPLSPVVKSPGSMPPSQPNKFIIPRTNQQVSGPSALNRFLPPQPPPQSAKPKHTSSPSNQFQLQQPPPSKLTNTIPSAQVIPPQPPPQASKPTVHPKPSVASKPSAPPKSNPIPKPNVLAPVPAVRKSFNAKIGTNKAKAQQQFEQITDGSTSTAQPLHTDKNFNNVINPLSVIDHRHHQNNNIPNANQLDSSPQGGFIPQAAPRPVPRPRPRQTAAPNKLELEDTAALAISPGDEQEPPSPSSYQWNLPTSAVPHFV